MVFAFRFLLVVARSSNRRWPWLYSIKVRKPLKRTNLNFQELFFKFFKLDLLPKFLLKLSLTVSISKIRDLDSVGAVGAAAPTDLEERWVLLHHQIWRKVHFVPLIFIQQSL